MNSSQAGKRGKQRGGIIWSMAGIGKYYPVDGLVPGFWHIRSDALQASLPGLAVFLHIATIGPVFS